MIKLSASSIKDYLACPAMVYYRINFTGDSEPNKYMLLGTIIHKIIELYPFNKTKGMLELKNKILEFPQIDADKARRCLDNFYKNFSQLLNPNEKAESNFFIKYKDYFMVGKLDRTNLYDHIIYDWKTTEKTPRSINNDIQFIIYYISYKKMYGVYPSVFYGSLTDGKLIKFKPEAKYIDLLYGEVIPNILAGIKNNVFYKKGLLDNYTCTNCSYKNICWENINNELVR